jgi:trans-aconitate methyltransferase
VTVAMLDTTAHFDRLYQSEGLAFGTEPDAELIEAVARVVPGRAIDLGGGQGRHCLPLARMGFQVELVDSSQRALREVLAASAAEGLEVSAVCTDVARYVPPREAQLVTATLLFHMLAPHVSLAIAARLGQCLQPGGLFYLSLPGHDDERVRFAARLLESAGCRNRQIANHVVTRAERPRLPIPRRNETRAFGIRA